MAGEKLYNAQDEMPPGYKMTELGPLPKEWQVVRLGEVAKVASGGSAPQGDIYFGGKYPFVRVQHLDEEGLFVRRWDLITDDAVAKYRLRLFPAGTIVFPKSGASIRLEKRAILPLPAYLVSHLCAVTPCASTLDRDFLFYALKNRRLAAEKPAGYPTLTITEIKNVLVPLPPLPEQRAIAHVLRTVQEAKEATERVIAALRELKKSLMRHLFTYGPVPLAQADQVPLKETEIGPIPEHWQVVRLGEVASIGPLRFKRDQRDVVPFIPMSLIPEQGLFISRWEYKPLGEIRSGTIVLEGDLLLAKITPCLENGKQGIVKGIPGGWGYATTEVFPIRPQVLLLAEFLALYLLQPHVRKSLASKMEGTTGRRRLPKPVLLRLLLPLPPLHEQQRIAAILQAVDRRIQAEESYKRALEALFKTLLHELMTARRRLPKEFIAHFAESPSALGGTS